MLVLFFGASTSSTLASALILFAMVGEINRQRDTSSPIRYFGLSWNLVLREYRMLYPHGRYTAPLFATIVLAVGFSLVFVYLLFGLLPKYALPSR